MAATGDALTPGLYDQLVDAELAAQLAKLDAELLRACVDETDDADMPDRVAEVVADWVRGALQNAESARSTSTSTSASRGFCEVGLIPRVGIVRRGSSLQ